MANKSDEDKDDELREHVEELLQLNPPLYSTVALLFAVNLDLPNAVGE